MRRTAPAHRTPIIIEALESRQLLSAVTPSAAVDAALLSPQNPGHTPAQIRSAYGFDRIQFQGGKVIGDGDGQTIAIVNPYDDPNIFDDLRQFDQQFGIADPPTFATVDQLGGSSLPALSPRWAAESALDVEWAHAIAPAANIILVEANSTGLDDILQAVDTARHLPGVSVVSMSWGTAEFASERLLDALFTTPVDHSGVTFVAAAGDVATGDATQWPAISANVLSVGGTSLSSNPGTGAYVSESIWAGSAGGVSTYEPEPAQQIPVQQTGQRTTPDVSYNADPSSGYLVFNSVPYQGRSGWQVVGGTSAGAPQWAALVAIVDQGRQLNGLAPLDGSTGTLPLLYQSASGNFNPVGAPGDSLSNEAAFVGLGSPRADQLTAALSEASAAPPPAPDLSSVVGDSTQPPTKDPQKDMGGATNKPVITPAAQPYVRPATAAAWPPPPQFGPSPSTQYVRSAIQMSEVVSVRPTSPPPASPARDTESRPMTSVAAVPAGNTARQVLSIAAGEYVMSWVAGVGESIHLWNVVAPVGAAKLASLAQGAELPTAMAAPAIYHFAAINIPRTFGDALGMFINECAAAPPGAAAAPVPHARAWAVTLAVLSVDGVVLRYALSRRDRRKRKAALAIARPAAPARVRVRAVRAAVL